MRFFEVYDVHVILQDTSHARAYRRPAKAHGHQSVVYQTPIIDIYGVWWGSLISADL